SGTTPERDFVCVKVGTHDINGYRLRSVLNKEATTAEIYPLVDGHRFLNLVYIRSDKDEQQGASVWETVRSTLNIEAKQAVGKSDDDPLMMQDVGILNGHAIKLPLPRYPAEAKGEHVSGTVLVEVTIDEEGNVASAHTISGHFLLRAASEEAALKAKFTPTILCGKPVKVTGVITYNFIAR
ncbi:MAG TPA: energy transducer TonB, partial [Pyrinomonadaceae bacterium]|nr:energy transducer TonB [Pyrinomonadaceae bacterium]